MKKNKTVYEKAKETDKHFVEEVEFAPLSVLYEKIADIEKYVFELADAKKEDPDINQLKERLKVANQAYKEPLDAAKIKKKYLLQLIESKKDLTKDNITITVNS